MGMKWIVEAQRRGAKLVVVDPRFTRTAAHADEYVPIRPGADIAFQGAILRLVIENQWYDREFLEQHTNARYLIHPDFDFVDGAFTGLSRRGEEVRYDPETWTYQLDEAGQPKVAEALDTPGTVFWHLRRHFQRYTPELASQISGAPAAQIERVAKLLGETRPGVVMYALGATQHTVGVQQIRCYAILQLLLGNMGVPGGGVGANRGESNVQGATDMAVLWDKLPGYLPQPLEGHADLAAYKKARGLDAHKGLVNLLRAWFGPDTPLDEAYALLPRLPEGRADSIYDLFDRMRAGTLKGLVVMGQNPLVSQPDRRLTMESLASLDLLVVLDIFESETAAFWRLEGAPKICDTEVWMLPAAAFLEKPGTLTNSGRWVQGRDQVVDPPGDARPDLWILDQLFQRLQSLALDRNRPRDKALERALWNYGDEAPDYPQVLREIAGCALAPLDPPEGVEGSTLKPGQALPGIAWLRNDGSTACGNRLYAGLFAGGQDLSRRRGPRDPEDEHARHENWAYSWPDNQRILYDRRQAKPFARTAEGVARLFAADHALYDGDQLVRRSLRPVDGPLPEHYEPWEGARENPLHPELGQAPLVIHPRTEDHLPPGDPEEFPCLLTTGFLHEMWGGGAMSRRLGPLVEAQPEPFVEVSRQLATRLGLKNGQLARLSTARGEAVLKAVVTERLRPVACGPDFVDVVWAPMHWGELGDSTGASVNALTADPLEPNVRIQETKVCRCRIEPVEGISV